MLVAVAGPGALALPATELELGLPGEGTMAADTTQRKAYDLLSDSFARAADRAGTREGPRARTRCAG